MAEKGKTPSQLSDKSSSLAIQRGLPPSALNIPMPSVKPPKSDSGQVAGGGSGQIQGSKPNSGQNRTD
ncbi:hypothetical protein NKDENANG_01241 [Candidatus Entotheonellaceae bacterium PAL068K]